MTPEARRDQLTAEAHSPRENDTVELSPRGDAISVSQYLMQASESKKGLAARAPSQTASRTHIEPSPISNTSLRAKSGTWAKLDADDGRVVNDSQTHASKPKEQAPTTSLDPIVTLSGRPQTLSGRPQAPKRKTARELWKRAIAVANQVAVLARFRTLRDHDALEITRQQLVEKHRIGEGAFAVVDRYTLMPSSRVVAVKRLKPHVVSKSGGEEMLKEIALLRKLRHRNIVEFVGFGSWDTRSVINFTLGALNLPQLTLQLTQHP